MRRISLVLASSALLIAGCSSHGSGGSADRSAGGASGGSAAAASGAPDGGNAGGGNAGGGAGASGATGSGAAASRPSLAGDGVVSRSAFSSSGRTWPLTVPQGTLFCESGTQIIFTTPAGDAYGVNPAAQAAGEWEDIDAIRAKVDGQPADLTGLITAGQRLC